MKNFTTILLVIFVLVVPDYVMAVEMSPGKSPFMLLDATEFKVALEASAGHVVLLDARPAERYEDGHLKGAINLFAPDLEKNPALLQAAREDRILVYCDGVKCDKKTGLTPAGLPCRSIEAILPTKSGKAAMTVVKQGYKDVAVLYEGFPGWDLKGYEAFGGKGDLIPLEMTVLNANELKAINDSRSDKNIIVDLRIPSEYAKRHIPGSINMPLAAFVVNAASLNKAKRIIVYGNTLEQGHNAVRRLQKLGFNKIARADFGEWLKAEYPVDKK